MPDLPWWAWLLIAVGGWVAGFFGWLSWTARRAAMDTDLWEGGDPGTHRLTSDCRSYGASARRSS